jgi:hypothetical protein
MKSIGKLKCSISPNLSYNVKTPKQMIIIFLTMTVDDDDDDDDDDGG